MESLLRAFEPYRHFDPAGWLQVYRSLPVWAALVLLVIGALMLFVGSGRLFRLVATPMGAMAGLVFASGVAAKFGVTSNPQALAEGAAAVLGLAGLLFPPAVVFVCVGIPLGLMAANLAGPTDWLLGFGPGFIIGGAVGVLFYRPIGAVLSAAVGGWCLVVGGLSATAPFTSLGQALVSRPMTAVALAGFLAIIGITYQLYIREPPEEREETKRKRLIAEQRAKEDKALEDRWANYTKNSNKKF